MILTNCRLVPQLCEGFQEEYADIRIEGDSIAEILPAGADIQERNYLTAAERPFFPASTICTFICGFSP